MWGKGALHLWILFLFVCVFEWVLTGFGYIFFTFLQAKAETRRVWESAREVAAARAIASVYMTAGAAVALRTLCTVLAGHIAKVCACQAGIDSKPNKKKKKNSHMVNPLHLASSAPSRATRRRVPLIR
jgi:predicted histidine transporter YuiF (NhaC family)